MSFQASSFRPKAGLRAAIAFAVPLALALSCSNNSEEQPPPPPGPVAMAIEELLPRDAERWHPGDSEPIVVGCDDRLGVTVSIYTPPSPRYAGEPGFAAGDWLFRPPGVCSRAQCGTLVVSVEPVAGGPSATGEAALETVVVDLAPLGEALDGRLRIHAELRENGKTPAVRLGQPLADELEVEARREDCGTGAGGEGGQPSGTGGSAGTAGSGATGGSAGGGGTGNQGGEAGAPGTGGSGGNPGGAGPGGAGGEGGV